MGRSCGGTRNPTSKTYSAVAPFWPIRARILSVAVLKLDGLARNFGEREALSEVSLSLAEGQTLVVFGPNGAGKTTLLRVLATLLRPHTGSVSVLGASLPEESWA